MLDIVFYIILLVAAIVVFIENLNEYAVTRPFDIFVICKIAAAMLLIISICVIRAQVQRFSNRKLSTRDCLMTVHTICFFLTIMSNVISQIMTAHTTKFKKTERFCRLYVSNAYFQSFAIVINIGIVALFTYMASNMCKTPLQAFFKKLAENGIITTE